MQLRLILTTFQYFFTFYVKGSSKRDKFQRQSLSTSGYVIHAPLIQVDCRNNPTLTRKLSQVIYEFVASIMQELQPADNSPTQLSKPQLVSPLHQKDEGVQKLKNG